MGDIKIVKEGNKAAMQFSGDLLAMILDTVVARGYLAASDMGDQEKREKAVVRWLNDKVRQGGSYKGPDIFGEG